MKAVVFHGVGDIRLEDVPVPTIKNPTDVIIEVSATAICGTDQHFVHGRVPGMKPGTILGHEAIGLVVEIGRGIHNLKIGDRVVACPTIACGNCSYCRDGYFAQCDYSNPHGRRAGTAFFGGPKPAGGYDGLHAELARIPFANVGLVKLPDHITKEQAILLCDVFPSGYFGAELAEVTPGDIVAVFGCGPVGQFAIASAFLRGAGRVIAVDNDIGRLELACSNGAETINFDREDPVSALLELTRGIGADRVIDAVGMSARGRREAAAADEPEDSIAHIERQRSQVCDDAFVDAGEFELGVPEQSLMWAVDSVAKSGTLAIVGVYAPRFESFPIGTAFERNLTVKMGICHHRRYIPQLVQLVAAGQIDPSAIMPQHGLLRSVAEAYETMNRRENDWAQLELAPHA